MCSAALSDIFSGPAGGYETLPWEDLTVKFFPLEWGLISFLMTEAIWLSFKSFAAASS